MSGLFPFLPVFLDLAGRGVVLLAGVPDSPAVVRRFLDAGAAVTVIDPDAPAAIAALSPPIRLLARRWRAADMTGAALIVCGPGEPRAGAARQAARAAGAMFGLMGDPNGSEMMFGPDGA